MYYEGRLEEKLSCFWWSIGRRSYYNIFNVNTKLSFDFGRFDYIKDFIKMVVKVKLENGTLLECLNITAEELEMLRNKFLGDSTRKLDLK